MSNFIPDCLMTKSTLVPTLLRGNIITPDTIDLRDRMLPTENQGTSSTCAAHAATSWLENLMWMRTGVPVNYDPYKLYTEAKRIDGYSGIEGTTLDAVLNGLINLGWYEGKSNDILCINPDINILKRMIHKYGPTLVAFNISESWIRHNKLFMTGSNLGKSLGGHAVIAVGYNKDGLYIQNSWGVKWGKYGFALIGWKLVKSQLMYFAIMKNCLNNLD